METDYERRLRETVEEVQSCDAIRVHRFEQGTLSEYLGDAAHAFELIGRVERTPLPADLARNFHRRSDVELAWRAKEPDEAIAGEFSLVHVADALLAGPSARLAELSAYIQRHHGGDLVLHPDARDHAARPRLRRVPGPPAPSP